MISEKSTITPSPTDNKAYWTIDTFKLFVDSFKTLDIFAERAAISYQKRSNLATTTSSSIESVASPSITSTEGAGSHLSLAKFIILFLYCF